jgi:hypothetical protein
VDYVVVFVRIEYVVFGTMLLAQGQKQDIAFEWPLSGIQTAQ